MNQESISEVDLMVYCLAVDRKYYELIELYGLLFEYAVCPKCKYQIQAHFKLFKEIINSFGGLKKGIRIPSEKELEQVSRDITIWKGLLACESYDEAPFTLKVDEYAKRYGLTMDSVYKIRHKVQGMVNKFLKMRQIFKKVNKK